MRQLFRSRSIKTCALGVAVALGLVVGEDAHAQFGRSFDPVVDASVSSCGTDQKCSASKGGTAGSCRLNKGVMTIRRNGKVSWTARVASSGNNNAYCTTFSFYDRNGLQIFKWPRICSQRLSFVWQTWSRDTLAVPEHLYDNIRTVRRADHC